MTTEAEQKRKNVEKLPLRHVKDGYNLPSHDALAQILPHYLMGEKSVTPQEPADRAGASQASKRNINTTYHVHQPHKRPPLHDFMDDPHVAQISDLQTKEMKNYRSAMSRMAEDIIALRTQVVALESENSQLRSDLSLHQDLGRNLLDDTDIDVMTKAEIADRIASLKFKLASETSKAASQRDRIHQLQNELIRKNDSEKELLKLKRIYQQQEKDLQQNQIHMEKLEILENTMKQQEKVIVKMEKALDGKLREKNKQNGDRTLTMKKQKGEAEHRKDEIQSSLAAENARLREELDRIRQQPAPVIIEHLTQKRKSTPVSERLSLLNKLKKAEARIHILETQLEENSKLWGKHKQQILTKLNEHRHGFVRKSSTILYNVPTIS